MADLQTVILSVAASAAVQSSYFVWMQFPSEARIAAAELVHQIKSQRSKLAVTQSLLECLDKAEDLLYRCLNSVQTLDSLPVDERHSLLIEHDDLHGTLSGLNFSGDLNHFQYLGENTLVALEGSKRNVEEFTAVASREKLTKSFASVSSSLSQATHLYTLYMSEQGLAVEKANAAVFAIKRRYQISSWIFILALAALLSYLTGALLKRFAFGSHVRFVFEIGLPCLLAFLIGRFALSDWNEAFEPFDELRKLK